MASRCLAKHLCGWDPEEAFITGLLARIGKLVLATGMPDEYEPVHAGSATGEAAAGTEASLEERERRTFGIDHLEVGQQLLKEWNLPEVVWKTAGLLAPGRERSNRSAKVVAVGDALAAFMVADVRRDAAAIRELATMTERILEIDAEAFRSLLGQIGQDWISYGGLLSVHTQAILDLSQIEHQAEEHRSALRLASEIEVQGLRAENEQLGRLARRDRLTGLLNRAAFDEALAVALKSAAESNEPLAMLLIDADHFKNVNDTHGHRVGDSVLEHLARTFDDSVRKRDQVFRYGGEEFAILAPNCSAKEAGELAELVRAAAERATFSNADATIQLSVSLGLAVAHWPAKPFTEGAMVEWADQRLYEAKEGGRNTWRIEPGGKGGGRWWSRIGKMIAGSR